MDNDLDNHKHRSFALFIYLFIYSLYDSQHHSQIFEEVLDIFVHPSRLPALLVRNVG